MLALSHCFIKKKDKDRSFLNPCNFFLNVIETKLSKNNIYFTLIVFLHIEVHTHLHWGVMQKRAVLAVSFSRVLLLIFAPS